MAWTRTMKKYHMPQAQATANNQVGDSWYEEAATDTAIAMGSGDSPDPGIP